MLFGPFLTPYPHSMNNIPKCERPHEKPFRTKTKENIFLTLRMDFLNKIPKDHRRKKYDKSYFT